MASSGNHSNPNYNTAPLSPTSKSRVPPTDYYDPEAQTGTRNRFHPPEKDVNSDSKVKNQAYNTHKVSFKFPKESMKRIDYVLIYSNKTKEEYPPDSKEYEQFQKKLDLRKRFEDAMKEEQLHTQKDIIGEDVFVKIHTPLNRLCQEAENMNLEMPLYGMENYEDDPAGCVGCWGRFEEKHLITDSEVDFVSAPFELEQMEKFENHSDADKFFRPALRYLLTHHVLINIDIRDEKQEEDDPFAKKGLPYLKMKGVYTDGFILHDETLDDPTLKEDIKAYKARLGSQFLLNEADMTPDPSLIKDDTRKDLDQKWAKNWFKYQPLWRIRNYFGEKIAFYFAWAGTLISSLIIPTILGLAIFFYGLSLSITHRIGENTNTTSNGTTFVGDVQQSVEDSINILKESFDNNATPYFALIICLWGTIFLEVWKRKNYTLAYEWDVNSYEDAEPDRPEFYGIKQRPNPVIPDELEWIYPIYRQIAKYALSFTVLIFMVLLVFICAAAVVVYRVYMTVDYCTASLSSVECLIVSILLSSVLQAVAIMILGKIYDKIAVYLTNWENHRTQTQYDDSLIIKTFAFQFANSYTSLFYIAFFRGINYKNGIFGLGEEYQDSCGTTNNCMAMLSLQVLVLMILKPLPRFLKDVIIPFAFKIWRLKLWPCLAKCCKCCRCCVKVEPNLSNDEIQQEVNSYMKRERMKPPLQDFTLLEYTEKVLVYGFLMLFSASLPLAPLIALLVTWLDIRIDARRMLWWYRRPIAYIAQDIGMWYGILQFLNMSGVATNAFLIAFTSAWGKQYTTTEKLWIIIGFEHIVLASKFMLAAIVPDVPRQIKLSMRRHIVFAVKFILAALIPDVPARIELSMKREKYQVAKILAKGNKSYSTNKPGKPHPIAAHFSTQLGSLPPIAKTEPVGDAPPEYNPIKDYHEEAEAPRKRHRRHKKKQRSEDTDVPESNKTSQDLRKHGMLLSYPVPSQQAAYISPGGSISDLAEMDLPPYYTLEQILYNSQDLTTSGLSEPPMCSDEAFTLLDSIYPPAAVYNSPSGSYSNLGDVDGTGYSTGNQEEVESNPQSDSFHQQQPQQSGMPIHHPKKLKPLPPRRHPELASLVKDAVYKSNSTNPEITSAHKAKRYTTATFRLSKEQANEPQDLQAPGVATLDYNQLSGNSASPDK